MDLELQKVLLMWSLMVLLVEEFSLFNVCGITWRLSGTSRDRGGGGEEGAPRRGQSADRFSGFPPVPPGTAPTSSGSQSEGGHTHTHSGVDEDEEEEGDPLFYPPHNVEIKFFF